MGYGKAISLPFIMRYKINSKSCDSVECMTVYRAEYR